MRRKDNEYLIARAESAEAQLERCQEALREIAAKGDYVETAVDGSPQIVCIHPREVEMCAAIARKALSQPTEPNTPEETR